MLVDTHCHINIMVKKEFDTPINAHMFPLAQQIMNEAKYADVTHIINVGTSVIESINCIKLAQQFEHAYATIGIHPNDCTPAWRSDVEELKKMAQNKIKSKIVGIGECGLDFHYPDFDKQRQIDAFKAQIELALEHKLALVIHSRDAADETLKVLDDYQNNLPLGVFHCFSYDASIAREAIARGFVLGIGGTVTYPKNEELRTIVRTILLDQFILETDAPYLPPQYMRGKPNHPREIRTIATYIAELRNESFEKIAEHTTHNAFRIFKIS